VNYPYPIYIMHNSYGDIMPRAAIPSPFSLDSEPSRAKLTSAYFLLTLLLILSYLSSHSQSYTITSTAIAS